MTDQPKYEKSIPGNYSNAISMKKSNQIRRIANRVAENVKRILEAEDLVSKRAPRRRRKVKQS